MRAMPRSAALLLTLVVLMGPAGARGASPPPDAARPTPPPAPGASPGPLVGSGDSRSDGGGPGIVGSPLVIALGVILLGAVTAAGTLVVIRATRSRRA